MQYFPNLKQGDPINRKWFNDLIGFCNSLVLRGDVRTTRVNRTASGTTVSTIPQPQTASGGGGGGEIGKDFIVTTTGALTVHVAGGRIITRTFVKKIFGEAGVSVTLPSSNGSYFITAVFKSVPTYDLIDARAYLVQGNSGMLTDLLSGLFQVVIASVEVRSASIVSVEQITNTPVRIEELDYPGMIRPTSIPNISSPTVVTSSDFYATEIEVLGGFWVNAQGYGSSELIGSSLSTIGTKDTVIATQNGIDFVQHPNYPSSAYAVIGSFSRSNGKVTKIWSNTRGMATLIQP